jgi:ribonuclease R
VVGTYRRNRYGGFALPDDRRLPEISISRGRSKARAGDKILVNITRWPDNFHALPEGKIVEVIGPEGEPGVDITSIQKKFGFSSSFSSTPPNPSHQFFLPGS